MKETLNRNETFFYPDICLRFYVFNRGRAEALTNIINYIIAQLYNIATIK